MSPEVQRFKEALRKHAEEKTAHIALWGDRLRLDYATLYAEVIDRQQRLREAQEQFVEIIHQLDPKKFGIADQIREASVLLLLRPLLVDLLCASGMSEDDARAELPAI